MKRREHEVGQRVLTDGRVQLDYLNPATGKRVRTIVKNKTIARQEAKRIEQAMEDNLDPKGVQRRFRDLATEYLDHYSGMAKHTVLSHYRNHVLPYWADWRIDRIEYDDVQSWVSTVLDNGQRSPHTVEAIFFAFSGAMTYARRRRYIVDTPCVRVHRPAKHERTVSPRAVGDFKLVTAALAPRYRIGPILAVALGARPSEVLALTIDRIDTEGKRVLIDRQVKGGGFMAPVTFKPPKDKEPRWVDVSSLVIGLIVQHLADHYVENEHGLLLTDPDGWPVGYDRFRRYWREARIDADVASLHRFHDLRHLSASVAYEGGASLVEIQARLGHDSVTTTRRYISQLAERAEASTRALDAVL